MWWHLGRIVKPRVKVTAKTIGEKKNCEDIILIDKRLSTRERWKKNKETEKALENKTSHSSSLPAYTQWQHKSGSNDS